MSEFVTAAFNSQVMLTHFWCLSCRSAPSPIKICCGVWQATSCIPQMHVLTVPLHWLQMGKKLIQRSVLLSTFVFYPCVSFLFLCLLSSTLFQSPLTTCQICATNTKCSTRAKTALSYWCRQYVEMKKYMMMVRKLPWKPPLHRH